jgi:hypothetical protein
MKWKTSGSSSKKVNFHFKLIQISCLHLVYTNLFPTNWLKRWRVKANENKSTHVTFTLNREKLSHSHTKWNTHTIRKSCPLFKYLSRQKTDVANSHIC